MHAHRVRSFAGFIATGFLLISCQGSISEKPPIHPNMNMDQQPRKEAQEVNSFFEDGRSMRQPVEGTIARGLKKDDVEYYQGVTLAGDYVEEIPVALTKDFIYRGKRQYEIFCTPCHGGAGYGQGIIMTGQYGYVPAPSYHEDRLVDAPDGELYSAIYNGVRSMPSYATQIPVEDRWAIVAYIRALQRSQRVEEQEMMAYNIDLSELEDAFNAEQQRKAELLAARTPSDAPEPSIDLGKDLVTQNACATCHNIDGAPGGIGPTWAGLFGSTADVVTAEGETISITKDEDYIRESIVNPEAKKTTGYEYGVMASYDYLQEHEIESLVLYIKSITKN
ncbi:MAG: c-type cytochrome [Bacteroidota bacterium]